MQITALKPFVPSGKDFELAKAFFKDLGFAINWEAAGLAELRAKEPTDYPWGQREVHLIDIAGVCWHFG